MLKVLSDMLLAIDALVLLDLSAAFDTAATNVLWSVRVGTLLPSSPVPIR